MTDRYDQEHILGYIEGELNDAERDAFEAVLAHDHELRNLVSQMKIDRENLRKLGGASAPVGLIDQVIQAQERAELLGDPEAPDPLPLRVPVSRRRVRRVLAYTGIAAVLLLSAALIVPSLMPSGLLNHQSQFAKNSLAPGSPGDPGPAGVAVKSGPAAKSTSIAKIDEDAVYDESTIGTRTLADADAEAVTTETNSVKRDALAGAEAVKPGVVLADAEGGSTDPDEAVAAAPDLAMAEVDATAGEVTDVDADEAAGEAEVVVAEADTPADMEVADAVMARADREDPADAVETEVVESPVVAVAEAADKPEPVQPGRPDPFTGYDSDDTPVLTGRTQLLVNAASPTRARRDIRDWAFDNSVRVIDETATIGSRALAVGETTEEAATSHLIVEIDEDQLPALLAHLNRVPNQRAELVTLTAADAPLRVNGRAETDPTGHADERLARNDEPADDHSGARANRPTDIRTRWHGTSPGLATGLAPMESAPASRGNVAESESADESETAARTSDAGGSNRHAAPDPFDWSNLLDNITIKPARPIEHNSPLLQPEPKQKVRLRVVIEQAVNTKAVESEATDAEAE